MMRYPGYYQESPMRAVEKELSRYNNADQKTTIWNAFVDSELTGVTDDDFSVVPRVLPASYLPTLKRTAYLITKFCMQLLSLPEKEIRAIVPRGPIRDHLIDELQILRHRHNRITGSFRFDMAIVGPPDQHHPPYLLEINEIGFDGLARSSFFQKVLLENMPTLRHRLRSLDTAAAEVRNMQRLGNKIARIQYDSYNWDEEYLVQTAERKGAKIHLVCPKQFGLDVDSEEFPLLGDERLKIINNRVAIGDLKPDAVNMSFAFTLKDYQENHSLYSRIVQSKTPQYGPFLTGLVASKSILTLLADKELRKKLLGSSASLESSILPAHILSEDGSLEKPREWVLKHADGYGGLHVFMNEDLEKQLKKIPPRRRHEWILQKKTELNLINVNGLLSRPKKAISDLGVFVHYDWSQGRFLNFEMGGLMCRATNRSLKVNVSSGGLQAAVFLDRSA